MIESLTKHEISGLSGEYNLSDGHAYSNIEESYPCIPSELEHIWQDSNKTKVKDAEVRFRDAFASLIGSQTLKNSQNFKIAPTASNSIDLIAAYLSLYAPRVLLVEPTFDNLALMLKRRGCIIESVDEKILDDKFEQQQLENLLSQRKFDALFLVNPNNPTGTSASSERLEFFANHCAMNHKILIIDSTFRLYLSLQNDERASLEASGCSYFIIEDTGKTWPTHDAKASLISYSETCAYAFEQIFDEVYLCHSRFSLLLFEKLFNLTEQHGIRNKILLPTTKRIDYLIHKLNTIDLLLPMTDRTNSNIPLEWIKINKNSTFSCDIDMIHKLYSRYGYEVGSIRSLNDFESLPMIDKAMLINDPIQTLLPTGLDLNSPNCYWTSTSGSSGVSLPIFNDLKSITQDSLAYFRLFQELAGSAFQPDRWIYNIHHIRGWVSSLMGDYPTFTLNDIGDAAQLVDHLEVLRPVIINTLPSYLPLLEPHAVRLRKLDVKAIVTNSEASSKLEREHYSALFNTKIIDEYSSEEVGMIALGCEHHNYHPQSDHIHVEFKAFGSSHAAGSGRLLCTDFLSRTMPFIRYDHGDLVELSGDDNHQCRCGRLGHYISEISGRKDDSLVNLSNQYIPTASITNMLDTLFNSTSQVSSFRLIQKSNYKNFDFLYTGHECPLLSVKFRKLQEHLEGLLGINITLTALCVHTLPQLPSYKRKKILCEVSKND